MRKQKMDQKLIDRAVKVARQWNVFGPVTEAGLSPTQIKEAVIAVLDPYFRNKGQLVDYAIELLSSEAFRVIRIKQDVWAESAFNHVTGIYRAARHTMQPHATRPVLNPRGLC